MGSVVIRINEDGALRVIHRYSLRSLLRALRPEDSQRHRVVQCLSCSSLAKCVRRVRCRTVTGCMSSPSEDDSLPFLRLAFFFIVLFSMCITIAICNAMFPSHEGPDPSFGSDRSFWNFLYKMCLIWRFLFEKTGVIPSLIVLVLVTGALMRLFPLPPIRGRGRRRRGEELPTISSLIEHI